MVLAYRDLRVRYAQTFLGLLWALLQPLITLAIFALIFGRGLQVDTGGVPYPVYAMSGLVVWNYFAFVVAQSSQSVIGAQEMVKKIYFPRLILPLSKAVVGFVDFVLAFTIFLALVVLFGVHISGNVVGIILFFLLSLVSSLSVGIWLSALTIRFRDFQHVVPFVVQVGLYATPVAYPVSLIPYRFQLYFYLNPMTGVVEGLRWSLFGGEPPPLSILSFVVMVLLLISGLFYFRKTEKVMADLV